MESLAEEVTALQAELDNARTALSRYEAYAVDAEVRHKHGQTSQTWRLRFECKPACGYRRGCAQVCIITQHY